MKSFTKFFAFLMAMLVSFGMMAQSDQEFQYEMQKQESLRMMQLKQDASQGDYDPSDFPPPSQLQGGEDVGTAVVISSLPYSDAGTTSGYVNDYEGTCGSSGAPDVVYSFTPTDDYFVTIDLCGSSYDSKTYVFENTANNVIGCNDDACGLQSMLTVEMTAGNTYYIIVDGYGSGSGSYDMIVTGIIPPPAADPITSFPFVEDFENCDFPGEIQPKWGSQCTASVSPAAAYESACGAQLTGTSYNWFYYSSNCDLSINNNTPVTEGGTAFGSYGNHWAKLVMDVEPDGTAGSMQLDFMLNHYANYSFGYYNAFQVWVNGSPVMEKSTQETCWRGDVDGTGWGQMIFDLAAYQNDPQFDLELVFIGAYANDKVYIDNVQVWYVPSGDVEGIAYDAIPSQPVGGVEIGFLAEIPPADPVMTDATTGYYKFSNIPTEPIDLWGMYAFLDGVNYVTADVLFITGETVTKDWNIASPVMIVTPAVLEETMNPNEWRAVPISIFATAQGGPLHWTATIEFGPPPMSPDNVIVRNDINDPSTPEYALLRGGSAEDGQIGEMEDASRDVNDILCPEESVFSNSLVGYNNGYTISNPYSCQQQFTIEDNAGSLTFWTINFGTIPQPATFTIEVYEANGNNLGPLYASYAATIDGFLTAENTSGWTVYQYYFEFEDAIDLESGFIGLKANYAPSYWNNTFAPGASGAAYQNGITLPGPLAMCLGGAGASGWLDLSAYEGDVASGESEFVNALFDATGTEAGQVYTADVNFTAQPNISTTTVDVTMIIAGEPLVPVDDLTAELVNAATGAVSLNWTFASNDITFEYFLIRRDGQAIANTQNLFYTDMLPTYGEYCYTVSAVYFEGESVPAGPECVMWFIPELCTYDADPVYGEVWVGESETFEFTMENCGEGVLEFEFPGFEDPDFSMDFVTDVSPYTGTIAEGEMLTVMVTFDADGYGAGSYFTDLELMTNELEPDNERMITCNMFTYVPATLYGTVTDCNDGFPVSNVTVVAEETTTGMQFMTETASNGYYEMYVDAGTYDVNFSKLSLLPVTVEDVVAPAGVMTEVSQALCEVPYPVRWVLADPNEDDDECMVTWSLPMGLYEIIYDDGSADNFFSWTLPGGAVAVKFTPAGYPTSVEMGRFYVGDGTFPVGANFLGSPMSVGVLDDDGTNGMPGTILDSVSVVVNNYGWVDAGLSGVSFEEGSFYIVMWQTSPAPFGAPVGVDETSPTVYRSRTQAPGGAWMMSAYNDFMIRAVVDGPGDNVFTVADGAETIYPPKPIDGLHITANAPTFVPGPELGGTFRPVFDPNADRDFVKYRVAFVDGFDPDMGEFPWDGSRTVRGTTTNNFYNDTKWGDEPAGFYAYAVQAEYESDNSIWVYSNVAAHLLDNEVTVQVSQCDGDTADMATVILSGQNYPYQFLTDVTPATAPPSVVVFDSVITGIYNLSVNKVGYQSYDIYDYIIANDMTIEVVLQENEYPPRNLYVDPLTSIATWDEPLYIQLPFQGFEGELFPPEGWSMESNSDGWERSDGYSSGFWQIPPVADDQGDWFALAEDDSDLGDDCCTYLYTPIADLREVADYKLTFTYFWNGQWGSNGGFVLYTIDGGANWIELEQLNAVAAWTPHEIDLSFISGVDGESAVQFAFWYDDNGFWADGFAIDNVYIGNGPVDVLGYYVYLDEGFSGQTDADTRMFQYPDLMYGQVYEAAVAALYGCNVSEKIYYTFTSGYLYPPRNLHDLYIYNTNEVPVFWTPPMAGGAPSGPLMATANASVEPDPIQAADGRTYLTQGETPSFPALSTDARGSRELNDGLDIAICSSNGAGNDFSSITNALLALGMNSVTNVTMEPAVSVDSLLTFDAVLFGLNTFYVTPSAPSGDTLADYVDAGGGLVTSSPINATGYPQLPVGGRLLTDGYYPVTTGALGGSGTLGDYDPDHPIMEGVTSANGDLVINCALAPDAELVAEYSNGYAFVATKTITNTVAHVNAFIAATGYVGGDMDLIIYNALNFVAGGGGPEVPEGLLEFKIYRDLMHVGTVPYEGQKLEDTMGFVDNPVDPGCWDYTVTAVYDLGFYGFPGTTGESMHEGPDTVCVAWGYDLPFTEMWDGGNFDFNGWTTDAGMNNWMVNSQMGNDAPSAQFNWDPDPDGGYAIALKSAPMKADLYTEGRIWLDYHYYLDNRYATGSEMLTVEVYDGSDWYQVAQYSNMDDYDWTPQHIDITGFAMGRVFNVRFVAEGSNSFDIINWNVDNIYIYRECDAPQDLDGGYLWNDVDEYGAEIWWTAPELPVFPEGWIRWDNGVATLPVGTTEGGDWNAAIRWDAGQLLDYEGGEISKIQLYMADNTVDYIKLKIWQGPNASTLLYESAEIMPDSAQWVEYTVDPPVSIDVFDELWVGYMLSGQVAQTLPASMDEGPAIAGYGDKISDDGENWYNASDLEINGNWNLAAYVVEGINAPNTPLIDNDVYSNYGELTFVAGQPIVPGIVAPSTTEGSRDFTGFNVYRMGPGETEYTMIDMIPYEDGVLDYSYYDANPYPNEGIPYEVCYQVTAVWESDTDYCESMPAMNIVPITDDICIVITSVDDPFAEHITSLYPNPASDIVNITSSQSMTRLTVINYVGQVVYDKELNDERSLTMNASTLDAGVYIVKISTENGLVTKRLTITK